MKKGQQVMVNMVCWSFLFTIIMLIVTLCYFLFLIKGAVNVGIKGIIFIFKNSQKQKIPLRYILL